MILILQILVCICLIGLLVGLIYDLKVKESKIKMNESKKELIDLKIKILTTTK